MWTVTNGIVVKKTTRLESGADHQNRLIPDWTNRQLPAWIVCKPGITYILGRFALNIFQSFSAESHRTVAAKVTGFIKIMLMMNDSWLLRRNDSRKYITTRQNAFAQFSEWTVTLFSLRAIRKSDTVKQRFVEKYEARKRFERFLLILPFSFTWLERFEDYSHQPTRTDKAQGKKHLRYFQHRFPGEDFV